ncbi:hypothetical protein IFM89_004018 [Coptis chinensis]|uniref:Uncharacterized protein n=1 Tax=Coptis chinensis TaxID=261450 RepID=A0A835LAU1_9MAGN|nr:hypothetical protein IFM89_004018 [Coptis chinensis]
MTMSLQHLQHSTACQNSDDGDCIRGFAGVSFLPSGGPSFVPVGSKSSEIGIQLLSFPMEQKQKDWIFETLEGCRNDGGGEEVYLGKEINIMLMDKGDEMEGKIENFVPGKDDESGMSGKICSRGHWRPAEDAKLKELVSQYGPQNWNLIAEKLEGRSGKSCRLRWFNQLDPKINRRAFNEEEEERLLAAHRMYGNKWAMIARLFPGRTDNAVKNHWHVIMARRQREQSSVFKRRKLSCSQTPYKSMDVTNPSNACREPAITSPRDESVSTCTDLSLNSSSTRAHPCLFARISPQRHQQTYQKQMGSSEENMVNDSCQKEGSDTGSMVKASLSQSDNSDSSFEVSATDSTAINRNNLNREAHNENGSDKISVPFIDFLGVGAT